MASEIERKFLVKELPAFVRQQPMKVIEQGYLALDPNGKEVRLRKSNNDFFLTVKSSGTLSRQEFEVQLSAAQFDQLWEATEGHRLRKDRFTFQSRGYEIEVDVYHRPLKGLIVAEVEFNSEQAALAYHKESWMDQEVTHLNFLKNKNLLHFESYEALLERL